MATSKMDLKRWYGSSLHIPDRNNWLYSSFAASCIGIVRSVFRRHLEREIFVRFTGGGTASADQESGFININSQYLTGQIQDSLLDSSQSLAVILGIIVHEAAHFVYSPPLLAPFADYVRNRTSLTFNRDIAMAIGNIVEDIFIEAEVAKVVPSLGWMLDATNEVFFGQNDLKRAEDEASTVVSYPKDLNEVGNVLNLLIFAKTRDKVKCNSFAQPLFQIALQARRAGTLERRFELVLQIYEIVMKEIEEIRCNFSLLDKILSAVQGLTANHLKGNTVTKNGDISSAIPGIRDLNNDLKRIDGADVQVGEGDYENTVYYEMPVKKGPTPITVDKRYNKLAEVARQRATVNRPYGLDTRTGHHIRKLYKIATDSRIFSEVERVKGYKPMQVILLVDCSGSMNGASYDRHVRARTSIVKASEAATGACIGLMDGRCEVAVYGHTADTIGGEIGDTLIYRFKTFNEPVTHLPWRFGELIEGRQLRLSNNRDSAAIAYVGKKFTCGRAKRRVLIVISDGQPNARGCTGEKGREQTQKEVNLLRSQGIEVLSISIERAAIEPNDFIYGKRYNTFNEDPNVLEQIVRTLMDI